MAGIFVLGAYNENGESNWPSRWPTENLRERQRLDPIAFASQYLMKPVSMIDNPLKLEYLQFFTHIPPGLKYYLGVDPSPVQGGKNEDYFALSVIGMHPISKQRYIFEAHRMQIDPLKQVEYIREKYSAYNAELAVIEAYSAQKLFTRYFFSEGPHLNIKEAKGTNVPKGVRYASMVKYFTSGQVLVRGETDEHGDVVPSRMVNDFVTEWVNWNDLSNRDDTLDCVGKGLEATGLSPEAIIGVMASATPPTDGEGAQNTAERASLHVSHGQALSIRRRPDTIGTLRNAHRRTLR